jgi:MFS family permease
MVSLRFLDAPLAAVMVVSIGYGMGTIDYPLLNAAISEIAPKQQLAGALGAFLALMTAGGLLGPFLTGLLIDSSVSAKAGYEQAFQVIGVLALVGAFAAIVGMNPPRDARRIQEKVTTA